MYEGGTAHIEHMISRLDSIEDELLSFKMHMDAQNSWDHSWSREEREELRALLNSAWENVAHSRCALKSMRSKVKPKKAF